MIKLKFLGVLAIGLLAASCVNDNDDIVIENLEKSTLSVNLEGLENLGENFKYEGWVIVNGKPVSTGLFTVDDSGVASKTDFTVLATNLNAATKFVVSIEPLIDKDAGPSDTKILSGNFSGNSAIVNSTIVADFSTAAGTYILATPTDGGSNTDELSGVWFLDNSSGGVKPGLILPKLSAGWKYEGWAVINGVAVSTGTFTDASKADDNAGTSPFKGDAGNGPGYPGEDYMQNAPAGLTFPLDLRGTTLVITAEPYPDNALTPFTLKPLAHIVPATASDHRAIKMGDGPVQQLTGMVTRR
ncbi:hypothetical protein AUW17_03815 [Tenacibaculum dicentrarchi]|nr:hypothetical protein AUW17_03815 [Tenacibaculum dicentrarchi]